MSHYQKVQDLVTTQKCKSCGAGRTGVEKDLEEHYNVLEDKPRVIFKVSFRCGSVLRIEDLHFAIKEFWSPCQNKAC